MRRYLTTLRWYEDQLCSLSSKWLFVLCLACMALLGGLAFSLLQFLDDLAFLIGDSDLRMALTFVGLVLLTSAAVWVFSLALAALGRRLVLYFKGL